MSKILNKNLVKYFDNFHEHPDTAKQFIKNKSKF